MSYTGLSLDALMNAPNNPDDLVQHLRAIGALPTPAAQPAEPVLPELRKPNVSEAPSVVAPMRPPEKTSLPGLKSSEMPELPTDTSRVIPFTPSSGGGGVKPMTPPALSGIESAEALPPVTAPTVGVGSVPYYQNELQRATTARQGDKMSDHPSFLGKVGHVLGKVGNIALETLAPGVAMNIPGTDLYNRMNERRAQGDLAEAEKEQSTQALQGAETEEARARAKKLGGGEEEIVQDAAGNLVGWKSADGKIHSLKEEGTPQVYKDLADVWEGKQTKLPEGETPLGADRANSLNGAMERRYQVLHPGEKLPSDYMLSANSTQKDFDRLDKIMQQSEQASGTEAQRKEANAMRHEQMGFMQEMARDRNQMARERMQEQKDKEGEKLVHAYDKDHNEYLVPKSQAQEMGLDNITAAKPGAIEAAQQNYAALNDMGNGSKKLRTTLKAMDQNAYQKTLIQTALRGHPDDYSTRAAVALMTDASKDYVQSVFYLREQALGLPKQITGGSRVSEEQAKALWSTLPASSGDSKYAAKQVDKFDESLDRLWKKVPTVEGQYRENPGAQKSTLGGGGVTGGGGAPGPAAPGMKWQQNKKTGEYRQVPSNQ